MTSTVPTKRPKLTRRMAREPQADQSVIIAPSSCPALPQKRLTKASLVEEMLAREQGASMEELCQATSWQAHTTRAFLTGLRKKGRVIERSKREDGTTFYRMAAGAPDTQESVEADA